MADNERTIHSRRRKKKSRRFVAYGLHHACWYAAVAALPVAYALVRVAIKNQLGQTTTIQATLDSDHGCHGAGGRPPPSEVAQTGPGCFIVPRTLAVRGDPAVIVM
jgi:hypothetical protein